VCGCEQDIVAAGPEKGTRRFSDARRHPGRIAGFQVQRVDLIERVARLTLALKDECPTIRGEVSLATAAPFIDELSGFRQEPGFVSYWGICGPDSRQELQRRQRQSAIMPQGLQISGGHDSKFAMDSWQQQSE
jgi:hypothetical protein